jgi:hypothetical protein
LARTNSTSAFLQRQFDGHVGHQRADGAGHALALRQPVVHHQVQQSSPLNRRPSASTICRRSASPSSAMPKSAGWRAPRDQRLGMRGADLVVDVQAVGRAADAEHLGAQLVEHLGRDVVRRAVGASTTIFMPLSVRSLAKVLLQNSM